LEKKYHLPSPELELQARPAHIGSLYAVPAEQIASNALVLKKIVYTIMAQIVFRKLLTHQRELWSSQKIKIVLIALVLSFFIINSKVSNIIRRLMDDMKFLLIGILLLSHSIFINAYMVLFLFNNVIYVFLLL
jgi:hypothetical protein